MANQVGTALATVRRHGEVHVTALAETLRLPVKTVSGRLRVLERAGLAVSDPRGGFVYYKLSAPEFALTAIAVVDSG